jgi:hypothetical protein
MYTVWLHIAKLITLKVVKIGFSRVNGPAETENEVEKCPPF